MYEDRLRQVAGADLRATALTGTVTLTYAKAKPGTVTFTYAKAKPVTVTFTYAKANPGTINLCRSEGEARTDIAGSGGQAPAGEAPADAVAANFLTYGSA